ncbi:hypothetical protein SAMN05421858_1150 [Haladaptatus litoreus]|uniref:Uncharacterized protein n=1 Tax=Haladaptatus litoreus TaxID=553468 RepID=A0A1N6XIR0_9EURY|nr:hypothetical protein [Haladaptatus litoreus]SIR02222.1 hypothetical protein SAMN05421858_1150 [Haladaptatus litoreus]
MSQPETTDTETESTFLDNIEFLTGKNPNLGSFLLVVGMVTCVFIALFQFTLPTPISYLLTAGVLFVTVLSAIFAFLLDSLDYFERDTTTTTSESDDHRTTARPWVPAEKASAPLPPLLNFDAELRAYADMYDGDLPKEFDPFISDYLRLKTNTRNRTTIASDLRADLNPIGALFEDGTEGDRIYEDISQRLFRYIGGRETLLTLNRIEFYDEDGNEVDVDIIDDQLARAELSITNEGEATEVEAVISLYDEANSVISSHTYTEGVVSPGTTKDIDTEIFVPSNAERADATIRG